MQPDPTTILETLSIREPLIGLYDAPDPAPFAPLVEPGAPRACVFASFRRMGLASSKVLCVSPRSTPMHAVNMKLSDGNQLKPISTIWSYSGKIVLTMLDSD